MKNKILVLVLMIFCTSILFGQRNWSLYTNTTHQRDLVFFENNLVIATWGGLLFFDTEANALNQTMTTFEGLSGNNVRALAVYEGNELWIGIGNSGIDRYKNKAFEISLTQPLGLASLRTNVIYNHGNTIFIGSDAGLTIFQVEENFPFPSFKSTYNFENGLPFRAVNSLLVDEKEYLFLGTNAGFSKVHIDSLRTNNTWTHYSLSAGESVNSIDLQNNLFALGTSRRMISFPKDELENREEWQEFFAGYSFADVKIDSQGSTNSIYGVFGEWLDLGNSFLPDTLSRSVAVVYNDIDHYVLSFGNEEVFQRPVTKILIQNNKIFATSWGDGLYYFDKNIASDLTKPDNWFNFRPSSIHTNTIVDIASEKDKIWIVDGIQQRTGTSTAATGVSSLDQKTGNWTHYSFKNSELISDNIFAIDIDSNGNKWFGTWFTPENNLEGWQNGISVLDDTNPHNPSWRHKMTDLLNLCIYSILRVGNQMWATSFRGGLNILNNDLSVEHTFIPPDGVTDTNQRNRFTTIHKTDGYSYFGGEISGVTVWASNTTPQTGGAYWERPRALNSGIVYKIDSFVGEGFTQVWFASSHNQGVIWKDIRRINNETRVNWYRSSSSFKREIFQNDRWNTQQPYYVGEERIFGGANPTTNSVVIDPSGRVWIGSTDKGITMYDIHQDRFANFTSKNSPLISDEITALNYQESTGLLLIGTKDGFMTVQIGKSEKIEDTLDNFVVYPNPFRPENGELLKIITENKSLTKGNSECRIFDVSGQLIVVLKESPHIDGFIWDGTNHDRRKVSSGLYFYLIRTEMKDSARGQIVLIR